MIVKKLHRLKSCPIHSDKLNFFMTQSKGHIGKLYKFAIRRQLLKIKHPGFENRQFTVFRWQNRVDDNKVKSQTLRIGINSDTQRAGLRQCLSISIPSNIKTPSYESCMAAMRTVVYIVKFKSHPTGKIRNCLKFNEEENNSVHVLYYCPIAIFVWNIIRDGIKIMA